jgi:ABC-type lipoprotein release transport system permease subunit
MKIPFSYSARNLITRRLTTVLTIGGMALVVFVFAATLMLAGGIEKTLVETGSPDNVVVIRRSSQSEVQSGVEREQAAIIETLQDIAVGPDGRNLMAKELVVLITMKKKGDTPSNVIIRGIGDESPALRHQVRIIEGRRPRPGSSEIITGASISRRFKGASLGDTLHFVMRDWTVVGVFDAGNTGFSSEIWGDADQLMQAFRRPVYSSLIFRLRDPSAFEAVKARIETDPRLTLEAKRETRYYLDQSEIMVNFLRMLGITLTSIFSIGAVIGAMITMYSAVANRTSEIATLRAIGFQRKDILVAFLLESLFLGLMGGLTGLFFSLFLQFFTISTVNFQTFSELAFTFALSFEVVWTSIAFALVMGFIGGVLPAFRAARMDIVKALWSG